MSICKKHPRGEQDTVLLCLDCDNEDVQEAGRLKQRVALLEETLRLVQWGSCDGCGGKGYCPQCGWPEEACDDEGNTRPGKHAPDCFVGQALK